MRNVKNTSPISKAVASIALIVGGAIVAHLGQSEIGLLLVTAGLTYGGWAKGLHTPAPGSDDE